MADTTIKVDSSVRDRLAVLAAEQGMTIRDLVERLAGTTATRAELQQRQDRAAEYIRTHLRPQLGPDDITAGHQIWDDLHADRLPHGGPRHERPASGSDGGQTA